jgi:hypothetical protein
LYVFSLLLRGLCRSLLAGGLFGLSPLAWLYATQAEVFALHNALTAATLLLFICAAQTGRARYGTIFFCDRF